MVTMVTHTRQFFRICITARCLQPSMSRAQAESVIKNIIREISQECAGRGNAVSETLVAFMVKAVVLDPRNQFNVDRTLTKQDVRKLVGLCEDKLMDQGSPSLDTIKMQVYFDMNYTSRSEFINEHHRVLQSMLIPVSREITDSRVKTRDDLEGLYRKIVSYTLQYSGLGSPTNINTVREATAALQSVFPQSELGTFMSLVKKDKEQQLNELSMIVAGIQLFNKDSKKGGEGIEDLPAILNVSIPAAAKDIEEELECSQNLAWKYTAILERLMESDAPARDSMGLQEQLKQTLYNVRQHESFLKIIFADVIVCAKKVESLQNDLVSSMKLLREAVHSKTAVPTAHVFPHFTALGKYWSGLQDEMVLLSILRNIRINLQPFLTAQTQMFSDVQLESLLEGSEVKNDEQRLKESSETRVDPSANKRYEWIFPETTANFSELLIEYKGICGYTLVEKNGILLPGNPSVGVLKHREKYYVFSSRDAALHFASKADEYTIQVAEKAKCSPELIQLLELHQHFSSVTPYSKMQSGDRLLVKPIIKCDSCTQTDTHLLETNIVESYEWNEWELRRKAIKLANLQSRVTHSMQTDLSHMRRDNVTQTYLLKDTACQSKTDGSSNVPKPQVYLAGLRGQKNKTAHMIKINLTRSVSE